MSQKRSQTQNIERIQLEQNNSFYKSSPSNIKRHAIISLQEKRRTRQSKISNDNTKDDKSIVKDKNDGINTNDKDRRDQFNQKLKSFQEIDLKDYNINSSDVVYSNGLEKQKDDFNRDLMKFSVAHNYEKQKTQESDAFPNLKKYIKQQGMDIVRIRNASPLYKNYQFPAQQQSKLTVILEEHKMHNQPNKIIEEELPISSIQGLPNIKSPLVRNQESDNIFEVKIYKKRSSIKPNVQKQCKRSISVQNEGMKSHQKEQEIKQENQKFLDQLSNEYYIDSSNQQMIPSIDDYLQDKTKTNFFKKTSKNKSRLSDMVLKLEDDKIQITQMYKNDPYKNVLKNNTPNSNKQRCKSTVPRRLLQYGNLETEMDRSTYIENNLSLTQKSNNFSMFEVFKNEIEKTEPYQTPNIRFNSSTNFYKNEVSEEQIKQKFSSNYQNVNPKNISDSKEKNIDHSRIQFYYFAQNMIKKEKNQQNLNKNAQEILNQQAWNREDNIAQKMKLIYGTSPINTNSQTELFSTNSIQKDQSQTHSPKKWFQTKKKLSRQFKQTLQANKEQKQQLNQFLNFLKDEYEEHIKQEEKYFLKIVKQYLMQGKVIDEQQLQDLLISLKINPISLFYQQANKFLVQFKSQTNKIYNNTQITEENLTEMDNYEFKNCQENPQNKTIKDIKNFKYQFDQSNNYTPQKQFNNQINQDNSNLKPIIMNQYNPRINKQVEVQIQKQDNSIDRLNQTTTNNNNNKQNTKKNSQDSLIQTFGRKKINQINTETSNLYFEQSLTQPVSTQNKNQNKSLFDPIITSYTTHMSTKEKFNNKNRTRLKSIF